MKHKSLIISTFECSELVINLSNLNDRLLSKRSLNEEGKERGW